MMTLLLLSMSIASGILIGAASAAAAAGAACAGAIIPPARILPIAAAAMTAGAVLAGRQVTITISSRILLPTAITPADPATIMVIITVVLLLAYFSRLPLSTSQIAAASVAGVAIARCALIWPNLAVIILAWTVLPCLSYILAYLLQLKLYHRILALVNNQPGVAPPLKIIILISTGYLAFASGASNAGNAAGPIVSAGIMEVAAATSSAGIIIGMGALIAGRRLLPAMSTQISSLCLTRSVLAAVSSATILLLASTVGIPSSVVQLSAGAIAGASRSPVNGHVKKLMTGWALSIMLALVLSYAIAICTAP